jgi:type IV pilus assembly protein PilC
MPTFQYRALDSSGNEVQSVVEALSNQEAISKVRNKGLFPTKVTSTTESRKVKVKALPKKRRAVGKVKTKHVCEFARQLSTLQDAGLMLLRSLRTLERQQKSGNMKRVIGYVADDIEGGSTLSEAMAKHPKCFNRLFVNMISAGEVGGVLEVILARVADFMEKSRRLKSKVRSAMIYPVAVMVSAMIVVLSLMIFVIPTFAEVLTNLSDGEQSLPKITLFLMSISEWLVGRSGLNGLIVIAAPFLIIVIIKLIRRFQMGRLVLDTIKLNTPILRKVVYKTSVARWTRTLATLINAGVPILEALNITRETANNETYSRMLGKVQHAIRQGDTFANPLRQSNTVDWMVVNMIEVGEETGDMDKMLVKVANNFDEEADLIISGLMSLLEPMMILFLGVIVGTIVLAIFLPIIEILIRML